MTLGLPASGKTTWARRRQQSQPAVVLVAKDELRALLHGGRYSAENEEQVVFVRDAIVADALERGRDVIVHDTNLDPRHELRLREVAAASGAEFVVEDFRHVPVEICVARDAARVRSVGAEVIWAMWGEFLSAAPVAPDQPAGQPGPPPGPGRPKPVTPSA